MTRQHLTLPTSLPKNLETLIQEKVVASVHTHLEPLVSKGIRAVEKVVAEGLVLVPKTFGFKTEKLSGSTREAHERLYGGYVKDFNQVSVKADAVDVSDVGSVRDLKLKEQWNLNAVKLHELYFANIADPNSVLHVDSLPYMRLSRDWGTFDKWQLDFRACCLASVEGWALCVYDPFKQRYMNVVVDGHSAGVPVGTVPVVVMDMWSHAYFRDYVDDKFSYVNNMMRELNWTVVEARMLVAERAQLDVLYRCVPVVQTAPQTVLQAVAPGNGPVLPQSSPGAEEMVSSAQENPAPHVGQVV